MAQQEKNTKVFVTRSFRHVENGKVSVISPKTVVELPTGVAADVVSAQKAEIYDPAKHDKLVKKEKS